MFSTRQPLIETAAFRAPQSNKPISGPRILQHVFEASTAHRNRCFLRPNRPMNRAVGRASYSIVSTRQLLAKPLSFALPADRYNPSAGPRIMQMRMGFGKGLNARKQKNFRLDDHRVLTDGRAIHRAIRNYAMFKRFVLLATCVAALAGCASDSTESWVEVGGQRYQVEVAKSLEERQRGLMFRDEMATNRGMVFVHEAETPQAYWMKNTRIPLDILYLDSKRRLVTQQRDVPPCSAGDRCPPYPSDAPAKYVLELNAGQAAKLKLESGAEVKFGPGID
jgi:uncharacterized membrane protein (UPF0127 family)